MEKAEVKTFHSYTSRTLSSDCVLCFNSIKRRAFFFSLDIVYIFWKRVLKKLNYFTKMEGI